ncbi:MAG: pyruvate:ferredoxin (flavodoxin) oxidoreductase [Cyanobacteriota bacterium]
MPEKIFETLDGNEAAAIIAHKLNEVIAIYPITPASSMGELSDAWSSVGKKNIWGTVPKVIEMQSEGGAAAVVHGSLQTGSLTTTFTASQGLLLMIPNMYKIAGELTPTVFHVAARAIATHGLSIFGDHSDVMAARTTGFAMLCASSVQEAMDFSLISQVASLESKIPFIHFFDGFRTSHEINKIEVLQDEQILSLIDDSKITEHRKRALTPDNPFIRGTAQNPDVFFQSRERANIFYNNCPSIVQKVMDDFKKVTGRKYKAFEYFGTEDAERVIVMMGSGCEAASETISYLVGQDEKVGLLKVRLYRPFDSKRFIETLPSSVKSIAVLDRTKEAGSSGEPLYLDCIQAVFENNTRNWKKFNIMPKIVGGRYGLASKEFTPAMVKAVLDNLKNEMPKNNFTVGINDDVSFTSLEIDKNFDIEDEKVFKSIFYGLGSDGTVGANKNTIKIIGENTDNYVQAYFVYDSKKSGSTTVSYLRFGEKPIRSTYLIEKANFIGCHQWNFLEKMNVLEKINENGTFLLNTPFSAEEIWSHLPKEIQKTIIEKKVNFFVIDADKVAKDSGMRNRINTVMQTCFFVISEILPHQIAVKAIKDSIIETYSKQGKEIVRRNILAVEKTLENLFEVVIPTESNSEIKLQDYISNTAPDFVKNVLGKILEGKGDDLPVSLFPYDGTYPSDTAKWEKRNLAEEIPVWDPDVCIQCGKCAFVCPHSVIRVKVYDKENLVDSPITFKSHNAKVREWDDLKLSIQVSPEDCTGCGICVEVCPAVNKSETRLKAINMMPQPPLREQEKVNWDFFLKLPEKKLTHSETTHIRQQQVQQPLFEFSGACSGCGETPYLKLLSQLFGDRIYIANATGCSSIYGGNLPTTPWSKNEQGRGPAWSNSLFEDNAEFGLGMRVSVNQHKEMAESLLKELNNEVGNEFVFAIINAKQKDEAEIHSQRDRVEILKEKLKKINSPKALKLLELADYLVKKSVWIVGGDGWAYDIGFGGLDHVLASGENVKILVLDTEVYSNTGGQMSKSTPLGAIAKFASGGKMTPKKDLGMLAMNYGNVYVASVAFGAKDEHTLKAFLEAEAFDGPSIIIAYSHCIAHGINMTKALDNQMALVKSGQWSLYRYNPDNLLQGKNPFKLDSAKPSLPLKSYLNMENRFNILNKLEPEAANKFLDKAKQLIDEKWTFYSNLDAKDLHHEQK